MLSFASSLNQVGGLVELAPHERLMVKSRPVVTKERAVTYWQKFLQCGEFDKLKDKLLIVEMYAEGGAAMSAALGCNLDAIGCVRTSSSRHLVIKFEA